MIVVECNPSFKYKYNKLYHTFGGCRFQVQSLVLSPQENLFAWLKYASLCRKNDSLRLSHKTFVMLLGEDPEVNKKFVVPHNQPHLLYAYAKHLWTAEKRENAYILLSNFVKNFVKLNFLEDMPIREKQNLLAR